MAASSRGSLHSGQPLSFATSEESSVLNEDPLENLLLVETILSDSTPLGSHERLPFAVAEQRDQGRG
jgi:hypothetical protein